MDILNVLERPIQDKSIISYTFHHYKPYSPNEINKSDGIKIHIQRSDLFLHLSEAYIDISGVLNTYTEVVVKTVKNFPFYLFECHLESRGKVIDSVRDLGVVAKIKNLLCKGMNETKAVASIGWFPSDKALKNNAKLHFCRPLKEIFGFCHDYTKIMAFVKPELVLKRYRTDNNCFFSETANETVAITLQKVYLRNVPHVKLAPIQRLKFLKMLEQGLKLEMNFRAYKLFVHRKVLKSSQFFW